MPTGSVTPSGGGGPAAGSYLPVANTTGVTVDTTTYNDPIAGGGAKLTTLVFAASEGLLAVAAAGDAFPRWLFGSDPHNDGVYLGAGSYSPYLHGPSITVDNANDLILNAVSGDQGEVHVTAPLFLSANSPADPSYAPRIGQLSPLGTVTSGALPTLTITSGTGRQVVTTRDVETVTPFSGDGTNNAATCAIALSPDNVTYSTLVTESIAAALNLTGVLTITANVRVPAGWYIKLTATHGTLGTTTYY